MSMHRQIRTTQERVAVEHAEEQEIRVRAKRGAARLPNAWDDIAVYSQRCWKRYRRQQWRAR